MIPRTPHAMTPGHLAVLKQELSAYLSEVAARQHVPARLEFLNDTAHSYRKQGALAVVWRLAWAPGASQAEEVI